MIKELSWYIESGRFTDIVKELEEKAGAYASALSSGSADIQEREEEFRALCRWHMKRSGWRANEAETFDAMTELFDGSEINRKALDKFEKEVVKAHMYQKYLWEFMGTTGSMTVISKTAMKRDGFDHSKYLPIEYKRNNPPKSPLSPTLKRTPGSVPIYCYLDGSVSSEYDKEKAEVQFDILKDKSGFDWSGSGWDPNYEVKKNGWHGAYDKDGVWTFVRSSDTDNAPPSQVAVAESIPSVELIRDEEGILLYDPGKSLLSMALRVWLLDDGSVYGAERTDPRRTAGLIRSALGKMGAKKITAVCAETGKKEADAPNAVQTMAEYRRVLGDILSPDARLKGAEEAEDGRSKFLANTQMKAETCAGTELFRLIQAVTKSGATGDAVVQAIRSEAVRVPLSLYNAADRKAVGLTEADEELILSYNVPEEKRALFSVTAANLLKKERLLATGGISRKDILDMAHSYTVRGTNSEKTVSVETTFARLCTGTADSELPCEDVGEEIRAQLEAACVAIPKQETAEKQRAADAAVSAVARNFAAVRMSTGMTPEEAINAAVKIVGGKTKESSTPPLGRIEYVTPGMAGRDDGQRRIFMDIPLKSLVREAAKTPPQTKEATIQAVMANARIPRKTYNLFSEMERNAWYKTKSFRGSGLSAEQAEWLVAEERERRHIAELGAEASVATLSEETELDERHGFPQKQALNGTAAVKIVPATVRIGAEEAAAELNRGLRDLTKQAAGAIPSATESGGRTFDLFSENERAEFYKTEEFQESGLSEQEANDFVLAYGKRDGLTAASRALLVDAALFGNAVRHAKDEGKPASFADIAAASVAQEVAVRTFDLLSEAGREEFYKTEEYIASGIGRTEIEEAVKEYVRAERGDSEQRERFVIDAGAFARTAKETGAGGVHSSPQALRTILERSVIEKAGVFAEPFRAWSPESNGVNAPKPTAAVRAENAVRAREAILAKRNAANREERKEEMPPARGMVERQTFGGTGQDGRGQDSIFQVRKDTGTGGDFLSHAQGHTDTDGNPFTANDIMPSQTEIHSRQTTERKDEWKFAHSDRQDFGTSGNFSSETGRTHERAEISLPESVGTQEQSEIPPRQPIEPADLQNAYGFQSQQNAETRRNAAPRTRRNDMADSNLASEKRDDTREGFHDIIEGKGSANREMKTTPPGAQTEEEARLERMNAAYERDRAALAKTDPAFSRGMFRDIGHAEGSDELTSHAFQHIASKLADAKKERIKDQKRLHDE